MNKIIITIFAIFMITGCSNNIDQPEDNKSNASITKKNAANNVYGQINGSKRIKQDAI